MASCACSLLLARLTRSVTSAALPAKPTSDAVAHQRHHRHVEVPRAQAALARARAHCAWRTAAPRSGGEQRAHRRRAAPAAQLVQLAVPERTASSPSRWLHPAPVDEGDAAARVGAEDQVLHALHQSRSARVRAGATSACACVERRRVASRARRLRQAVSVMAPIKQQHRRQLPPRSRAALRHQRSLHVRHRRARPAPPAGAMRETRKATSCGSSRCTAADIAAVLARRQVVAEHRVRPPDAARRQPQPIGAGRQHAPVDSWSAARR